MAILDTDVHQGDGNAAILSPRQDVFVVSVHGEKNFPFRKSQSDWDLGLERHLQDDEYLEVVSSTFAQCLEQVQPDIVLYDAGVDVWIDEPIFCGSTFGS